MRFKKSIATLVLLIFLFFLATPALAGTFSLRWDYSDADGDPMTQWRWWFDAADYASGTVKNEGLTADASQVDADTYETTVDTTELTPDGAHTLKLQVHDGTEWSNNDTRTINLDTTVPNITITDPTGWKNANITINIQHSDGAGSGITSADYVITTDALEPGAGWSALASNNEDISITNEGQWYVHVQATDAVTNRNWQNKGPFQLDKTLPSGTISSHTNGGFINGNITLSGTASDGLSGLQSVEVSTDNGNTYNPSVVTDNWSYDFSVPGGDVENTEYKVITRVTDNAGNQFTTTVISLFKNSLAPTTVWTTAGNSYHKASLNLQGSSSDANTVDHVDLTYQFNGGAVTPITTLNNTTNAEPYNWSHSFTFPNGDGNYTFNASATDKGGLTENPSVQITNVYYDTDGPTINLVGPANTVKETLIVTGSATDTHQGTVSLTLDGNAVVLDGAGNFSETLTLSPGSNTFVFEATDGAGNTTTENYSVTRGQPDAPTVTPTPTINTIQYDWVAVTDAEGYEISSDNTSWVDLGNVLTTTVDTLTPNTSVTRYFRSYVGTATKMNSDSTTVTTSTLANVPTISSINVVDYQTIEVQMGLNGNPVGTELQVQVMDGLIEVAITHWSTDTTVQANGLEGNKNYQINIRARSFGGLETNWVDGGLHLTKPTPAELALTDTGAPLDEDGGIVLLNILNFDLAINTQAGVTYKYKLSNNPADAIDGGDPIYLASVPITIPSDGLWYLIVEGTNTTGTTRFVKQIIADTVAPAFTIH